jgi:phage replication-related protein YjqB (UPF0714/DUF867 family)
MTSDRPQTKDDFLVSLATTRVEYIPGGAVGVLALHAGVEGGTGEIAQEIANRMNVSTLIFWQEAPDFRLHINSSLYDPAVCSELSDFLSRSQIAISLHGHRRPSLSRVILVGGRNRSLARSAAADIRRGLDDVEVIGSLRRIPRGLRGLHAANPVNCTAGGGVQLELPAIARGLMVPDEEPREVAMDGASDEFLIRQRVIEGLLRFVRRTRLDSGKLSIRANGSRLIALASSPRDLEAVYIADMLLL